MSARLACVADAPNLLYTAISRKVVGKTLHATILKGNMGYGQYTVHDTVAGASNLLLLISISTR